MLAKTLSKTRFQYGVACRKRLWLDVHRRELAKPPDAATRLSLSEGHRVGRLARELWPRGVLVAETSARHARAVPQTRALLDDESVGAIFEGAFEHDGLRVRADVLAREPNGAAFDLIEVKSSLAPKPEHLLDLAVQAYVIDGSGLELASAAIMHLDGDYEWSGGRLDREQLFHRVDLTDRVLETIAEVRARVGELRAVVAEQTPPRIALGAHCRQPHECPFLGFCSREAGPAETAAAFPEAPETALAAKTEFPSAILDVQTFSTALPRLARTVPHERVPFAWSLWIPLGDGRAAERVHVADPEADPRVGFADRLTDALPESGPIAFGSVTVLVALARMAAHGDAAARACTRRLRSDGVDLESMLPRWTNREAATDAPPYASRRDAAAAYLGLREKGTSEMRRRSTLGSVAAYGRWTTRRMARLVERGRRI